MKINVLTMTGGEYIYDEALSYKWIQNSNVFQIVFDDDKKTKDKFFPTVNIETIEIDQ